VLCSDDIKRQPVIVEFTSFQDSIMLHKRGRFGLEKVQNSKIHVEVRYKALQRRLKRFFCEAYFLY